ncbi:MAG: c-type cytochrome biosis protein CcmI, partial [Pseudomonadota bacterium]
MTSFALLAALLLAVSLAFIMFPLMSAGGGKSDNAQRGSVNLAVLRDQLRELEQDLAQGIIDPQAHAQARHDLEIRVAQEVGPQTGSGLKRGRAT